MEQTDSPNPNDLPYRECHAIDMPKRVGYVQSKHKTKISMSTTCVIQQDKYVYTQTAMITHRAVQIFLAIFSWHTKLVTAQWNGPQFLPLNSQDSSQTDEEYSPCHVSIKNGTIPQWSIWVRKWKEWNNILVGHPNLFD